MRWLFAACLDNARLLGQTIRPSGAFYFVDFNDTLFSKLSVSFDNIFLKDDEKVRPRKCNKWLAKEDFF